MANSTSSGQPLPHVNPGDLITAGDWNNLIDKVQNLEVAVSELQAAGSTRQRDVSISQLLPSALIHRGETLEIHGQNFYRSIGASRVSIGGQPIQIKGGNDTAPEQLNIDIPIGMALGPAELRVSNSVSFDTRPITILEQVLPLTNDIDINWIDVSPQRITTGTAQLYTFHYQVVSHTNRKATFTFNPVCSVAAWQSSFKILDRDKHEVSSRQFELTPEQAPVDFYAQGALSPALAANGSFTLRIDATAEGRVWSQGDRVFRENELVILADPNIELGTPIVDPTSAFTDATNTIHLANGGSAIITFQVTFTAAETYVLVIEQPTTSGWSIVRIMDTKEQYTITQQQIEISGGSYEETIALKLTAPAASSPQTAINIGFHKDGNTTNRTVDYFILSCS